MIRTTARAALTIAARAVLFFGSACVERGAGGRIGSAGVSFQTDEIKPHFGAVIVTPDMNVERTGRGMRAGPDRRQVRQEG